MGKRRKKYFTQQRKDKALEMARKGHSFKEICKAFNISIRTFRWWRKEHPDFEDLLQAAYQETVAEVENSLHHAAAGYAYDEAEETIIEDGDGNCIGRKKTRRRRVRLEQPQTRPLER